VTEISLAHSRAESSFTQQKITKLQSCVVVGFPGSQQSLIVADFPLKRKSKPWRATSVASQLMRRNRLDQKQQNRKSEME
jgi:hypothetical protein